MDQNSNDIKWVEYNISELFTIGKGKRLNKIFRKDGNIPFVTSSGENNGISSYIDENIIDMDKQKNVITIDMFYNSFYHNYEFLCDDNVHILTLKNVKMTDNIGIYITTCLLKNKNKYDYGYQLRLKRLYNEKVNLPSKFDDKLKLYKPDYEYMETYINNLTHQKYKKYIEYANKQLENITKKEVPKLEDKKWDKFKIEDIFNIESTRFNQNIMDLKEGDVPLISASKLNNGVAGLYDIEDKYLDSHFISVSSTGTYTGYAFYHDYKCVVTNNCKKLIFKKEKYRYNKFISSFLCNQIMEQKDKYDYGYVMGMDRLKRQYIMLPIEDSGNIDYDYMEQFIKNIIYDKYNKYIEYANNQIN